MEQERNYKKDLFDKYMILIQLAVSGILVATGVIHGFFEWFVVAVLGYLGEGFHRVYDRR